jgi:hypothetical protein
MVLVTHTQIIDGGGLIRLSPIWDVGHATQKPSLQMVLPRHPNPNISNRCNGAKSTNGTYVDSLIGKVTNVLSHGPTNPMDRNLNDLRPRFTQNP